MPHIKLCMSSKHWTALFSLPFLSTHSPHFSLSHTHTIVCLLSLERKKKWTCVCLTTDSRTKLKENYARQLTVDMRSEEGGGKTYHKQPESCVTFPETNSIETHESTNERCNMLFKPSQQSIKVSEPWKISHTVTMYIENFDYFFFLSRMWALSLQVWQLIHSNLPVCETAILGFMMKGYRIR